MFTKQILCRPTAIEGFCGAGGLSLGLRLAGFDIRAAFDADPVAVSTYRRNFGPHVHEIDAHRITGAELLELAGLKPGELDLYAGGPPCPGFSLQRRRTPGEDWDPRNVLTLHHARIGSEMLPRVVLFENVPALLGPKNGCYIERIQSILWRYRMMTHVLDAWEYGAPQRRRRAVLAFLRDDMAGELTLETTARRLTVADAIGDLPPPLPDGSEHPDIAGHTISGLNESNMARLAAVPPGGSWVDLPAELQLDCHRRYAATGRSGGWRDVLGRMRWDEPAPTLTTGCLSVTKGRFVHPEQNRGLTPREAARLQGFPDSFVFCGGRGEVARQIGNAVPVQLAKAIGQALVALMPRAGALDDGRDRRMGVGERPQSRHTSDHQEPMPNEVTDEAIAALEQQISRLKETHNRMLAKRREAVIADVRRLVERYEITAVELGLADIQAARPEKRKVPIKFRKGSQSWSGRGKKPKWVVDYIASGGALGDLLIK